MNPKKAQQIVSEAQRQVGECALSQLGQQPAGRLPEIPGYEIYGEIHRGGQGVVFEAEQETPSRRVAIKLLRHGLASSHEDRFRFEREMQILGRLRHPNIVAIHDAGEASGCRYFVMDFISGEPLDVYIRHAGLSIEQTVQFFLKICDAIEAAHKRGIFHRDLKPSNIRVDDDGNPHILDFGLAADANAADPSITITGQFIGSLPWASPEQAAGHSNNMDARTDIYALGLILYHLLTERFPYNVVGPPAVVLDAIQYTEPARPVHFNRAIPYDLEQIVLKCLRKEQDQRYQSVSGVSGDLRRFLAHEPIDARSKSTWYTLRKSIRRHPRATVAIVGIAMMTVIYAATTTVLYVRALRAETNAVAAAQDASNSLSELEAVYHELLDDIAGMERTPGTMALRRELVNTAHNRLAELVSKKPGNERLSASFAHTLVRLGNFAAELGQHEAALGHFHEAARMRQALMLKDPGDLALRADLSLNTVRIGDALKELGDVAGARAAYESALTMEQQLTEAAPDNAHYFDNLSWSYQRLGLLALQRGEHDAAKFLFQDELTAARRAVELDPENPVRLDTLLEAEIQQARTDAWSMGLNDAKISLEAARRMSLCDLLQDPADGIRKAELRLQRAEILARATAKAMQPCVTTARKAAELSLDNPHRTRRLIERLRDYAHAAQSAGDVRESRDALDEAIRIASELAERDADVLENVRLLATVHSMTMNHAMEREDFEAALFHADKALNVLEQAFDEAPHDATLQHELFLTRQGVAYSLYHLARFDEANSAFDAAVSTAENARLNGLLSPEFQRNYGRCLTQPEAGKYRDVDRGLELMTQAAGSSCSEDKVCWEEIGNTAAATDRMDVACDAYHRALQSDGSLSP